MKNKQKHRLLIGGAAFFATLLTGCAGTAELPDMNREFTVTASISCSDFEISAELSRAGENEWEATMLSPFALEGMKIRVDSGGAEASLGGMSAKIDVDGGMSAVTAVISAIETAIGTENAVCTVSGDEIVFDGGDFTLTLERSGEPVELRCGTVTASFENAKFGEAVTEGELPSLEE